MYHIIKYKKRYKKALSSQAVKCIVTLAKKKCYLYFAEGFYHAHQYI